MSSYMLMLQLLLLSVFLHEAQGIRVFGGSLSLERYHAKDIIPNHGDGLCKSNYCSGRIRKLLTSSVSSTGAIHGIGENKGRPISKLSPDKKKGQRHDEKMSVNSSSSRNEQSSTAEPYPDILDIAGMDYSQARRKSPIHN